MAALLPGRARNLRDSPSLRAVFMTPHGMWADPRSAGRCSRDGVLQLRRGGGTVAEGSGWGDGWCFGPGIGEHWTNAMLRFAPHSVSSGTC